MALTISYKHKDWQESDIINLPDGTKTTTVKATFEATGNAKGLFTSVWAMYYTHIDEKDPKMSKSLYSGYTAFEGTVSYQDKQLTGSLIMSEQGSYDGVPHSTLELISTSGDLKQVKGVSHSSPTENASYYQFQI